MDLGKVHRRKDRKAVAQNMFQPVRFVKGIKKRLYECRRKRETSIAGDIGQANAFSSFFSALVSPKRLTVSGHLM